MITLAQLGDCQARELVKAKVQDGTEWAIVGLRRPDYSPLIFLTGVNAPLVYNTASDPGDFATYPVAKYGIKYRFLQTMMVLMNVDYPERLIIYF